MPVIPLFLFKLSISLSIVWIFYQLFLRRLTFYRLNRWYLLGYTILAFFIPLINIGPMLADGPTGEPLMLQFIPAIGKVRAAALLPATHRPVFSGWNGLLLLFVSGALLLLIRSAVRWLSLVRLRRQARRVEGTELKIYQVDAPIIPFSFGNAIYINQHLHTEKEWSDIILHEYVHIRQRHTVDILLAELVCILNWYNPFSWLIRYSIRQNLEFIADEQVLENGVDRKGYQYHLLKVVGEPRYRLANNFNFSSLKKRIVMMNKIRSARVHLLKLLFLVPLVAVLLLAFRDRYPDLLHRPSGPIFVNAAGIVITLPGKLPLAGVFVRDKVTGVETKTDANGYYKLKIPVKADSVRVHLDYIKDGYENDSRERFWPVLKETSGMLDVTTMQQPSLPVGDFFFIAPSMDGRPLPADPGYDDAEKELQRVLKENVEFGHYLAMEKEHPEIGLFYITEDKQTRLVIHTDGTIEKYTAAGRPSFGDMDKKYGALPEFMTGNNNHPVNSGYLARWAGISAQAAREFHATGAARAIIFPGDSRVIAVPISGKPQVYDMDNDAAKERAGFEQLYGKLPNCVPTAGNNTDETERKAAWPIRHAAGGARDTVPGGGDSARRRIQLIGIVEGKPDSVAPLYIVDGKSMPPDWEIAVIPVEMVKSINVIGPGPAATAYGERAKHGALLLTTKDPGHDWSKEKGSGGLAKIKITEDNPVHYWDLATFPKFNAGEPVLLIDGKEVPFDSLKTLNPDRIKDIQVYKDSAMASRFGAKGKNGVLSVHTKDWKVPLVLVDGREVDWDSAKLINPNEIESVNVLKAEEARPKYGEKGKNGVLLMILKAKRPDSEN